MEKLICDAVLQFLAAMGEQSIEAIHRECVAQVPGFEDQDHRQILADVVNGLLDCEALSFDSEYRTYDIA